MKEKISITEKTTLHEKYPFLDFAWRIANNYSILSNGDYFSDDNKYHIVKMAIYDKTESEWLFPQDENEGVLIIDKRINTTSRVGNGTGIVQIQDNLCERDFSVSGILLFIVWCFIKFDTKNNDCNVDSETFTLLNNFSEFSLKDARIDYFKTVSGNNNINYVKNRFEKLMEFMQNI